jgi:pyridoxamine 5'-phosphate oxidase
LEKAATEYVYIRKKGIKSINMNLADIRKEYSSRSLDEQSVHADPFAQFSQWMAEAIEGGILEPTAMNLATVASNGRPSARIVLLKGIEGGGFVFYTNYTSRKGVELMATPFACLTFQWLEMERQVRIEGQVSKVEGAVSDQYFASRPRGSQIGAYASPQSQPVPSRAFLENRFEAMQQQFGNEEPIERPAHWGGYRLVPDTIEFWQGRPSRLHDRVRYTLQHGLWTIDRLAP